MFSRQFLLSDWSRRFRRSNDHWYDDVKLLEIHFEEIAYRNQSICVDRGWGQPIRDFKFDLFRLNPHAGLGFTRALKLV